MSEFFQRKFPMPWQFIANWNLLSELTQIFLPRVLIAFISGGLLGFLAKFAGVSSLGYAETIFTAAFWILALMVVTFQGHIGRMLFWLLLLDASLSLYQVSIYAAVLDQYLLIRLGPVILGGILFVASCGARLQQSSVLYIIWIVCNLPALIPGVVQGYMNPYDAIVFWAFNTFYPLVFYFAVGAMKGTTQPPQILGDSISVAVLVMCLIPLLLIPVELTLRQTDSFASLQFGGRAYAVIGAVILFFPVLLVSLNQWQAPLRYLAVGVLLLLFITSFSRGVSVVFILLIVGVFVFCSEQRMKLLKSFAVTVLFLFVVGWFLMPQVLIDAGWFWLLRMNLVSNISNDVSINVEDFLATGRLEIWRIALTLFEDSPLWGHGIGSTPSLIRAATSNALSFSGMHNLVLTVLVERGLVGLVGVSVLLWRVGYLIYANKYLPVPRKLMGYLFVLFLIFANSTGVELFQNSSRSMNVTITVYIFLFIGYLEYQLARHKQISQLLKHSPHLSKVGYLEFPK
ncbi:MAG: O-antigen ligase family protein [Gammaproteobacteria bacterium]|nr:O-antigen ligase family protein [Gammaproteobacteria bacterium]